MSSHTPKNAAELVELLRQNQTLAERKRSDYISAIRTVVREYNLAEKLEYRMLAEFLIENFTQLDEVLRSLPNTCRRLSSNSMNNTISRFRSALHAAGIDMPNGRGHVPLLNAWVEALGSLTSLRYQALLPFAQYASSRDIPPSLVEQGHLDGYATDMLERCDRKGSLQRVRALTLHLDEVRTSAGLGSLSLPVPYSPKDKIAVDESEITPVFAAELKKAARILAELKTPWV